MSTVTLIVTRASRPCRRLRGRDISVIDGGSTSHATSTGGTPVSQGMFCRCGKSGVNAGLYRRGYVLVVTLGLLVLAAGLMVAVGRASLRHAVAARLAADDLQHRWGVISCRTAVLPYADLILLTAESKSHTATPVLHARVQLGEETFDITVADELAKANVNVLLEHTDVGMAEERLRQSLSGTGLIQNIHLRPDPTLRSPDGPNAATAPSTQPVDGLPRWITGFGQVFNDASPDQLLLSRTGVRITDLLTCWGGGRLNIRRISPAALRIAAGTSLSGIDQDRLITTRDLQLQGKPLPPPPGKAPPAKDPAARLMQAADLQSKGDGRLPRLVVDSTCHSIWITARDKRRAWHYLSILDRSDNDHPRAAAFVW